MYLPDNDKALDTFIKNLCNEIIKDIQIIKK